jgi:hypothetical protein
MKQVFNSRERAEAVRAKRVLEEHLIPCFLITNGKGDWKIYLNVATYAPEFDQIASRVDELFKQYAL